MRPPRDTDFMIIMVLKILENIMLSQLQEDKLCMHASEMKNEKLKKRSWYQLMPFFIVFRINL
jgi:hypothetical protein